MSNKCFVNETIDFLHVNTIAEVQPYSAFQRLPRRTVASTHHGAEEGSVYGTKIRHFCRAARNEGRGGCLNSTITTEKSDVTERRVNCECGKEIQIGLFGKGIRNKQTPSRNGAVTNPNAAVYVDRSGLFDCSEILIWCIF